jgi:predicted GNAT superfamily acetyltransferase
VTFEPTAAADRARGEADSAAAKASVAVRQLADRDECADGSALLARIWGTQLESAPFTGDVLTSLLHAGGCVLGAFDGPSMIGLTVGIAGAPKTDELYSMIAGVDAGHAGRGVGLALKLAQRVWALEHGATSMVWTFDPLIRRNAHFNINRLGARIEQYLPDFYPPMHDALNRADLTDRLVAVWDLLAPRLRGPDPADATVVLRADDDSEPVRSATAGTAWLVGTPRDIEAIRVQDATLARRWRMSIREVMQDAQRSGHHITGFTESGQYVLEQET